MTAANDKIEQRSLDAAPLFGAFREILEQLLDLAADAAKNFPFEVGAVERVRTFFRRRIAGYVAHVGIDDLLFTLALMLVGLERQRTLVAA